ncbi:MAG: hypothetical protein ABIS69_05510, partial [Sediminibacterium sp.]
MRSAFVLLLLIIPICLLSQDKQLRLPIKIHDGFGPFEYYGFFPVDWNTDSTEKAELLRNAYPDLKGIPPGLKNIRKTVIVFSYRQFLYQSFLAGKISKEKFIKFKEESRWIPDEKELGKEEMKCYVSIINGEDKEGKQVFILDANNNLDMSDDKIFIPADSKISEKE